METTLIFLNLLLQSNMPGIRKGGCANPRSDLIAGKGENCIAAYTDDF